MKTSEKIIEYLKIKKQVSTKELVDYLGLSRMAVFNQLNNLLADGRIVKTGRPPKVFYALAEKKVSLIKENIINQKASQDIDENYLIITPSGERKEGVNGFAYWCEKNNLPLEKTAMEYGATLEKYHAFKKDGLIDGIAKFRSTFPQPALDRAFYMDFYSIERFGKTKLGQLLLYAKQSQDRRLMKELVTNVQTVVDGLVKKYEIDAVGFIPPTVKREVQFMRELERGLNLAVKKISIVKIKSDIVVPQKTLSKPSDRIENARKTIVVDEKGVYNRILLIDDAVGSGATLNETAVQIKEKGIAKEVIGFSITGSFKGFDVISEV